MNPAGLSASVYELVCRKCNNSRRVAHFDEFVRHPQEQHGGAAGLDMAIVPQDDAVAATTQCSSHADAAARSTEAPPTEQHATYDLRQLPRQCLIEMAQLLGKCLCIWHKPSRRRMTRRDRFHAYQLLLRKLREYQPEAKFHEARTIVRQIIIGYLNEERGSSSSSNNITNSSSSSRCDLQLEPVKSRTILEQLLFLSSANASDTKELDIDQFCAFCNTGFSSTAAIFAHMVQHHLPARQSQSQGQLQPQPLPSATAVSSISGGTFASDMQQQQRQQANALARPSVYSLRCKSHQSTPILNSKYEADASELSVCHCNWLLNGCHNNGGSARRRRDAPKRKRRTSMKKRSQPKRRLKRCRRRDVATPAPRLSLDAVDVADAATATTVLAAASAVSVQPSTAAAAAAVSSLACLKCQRSFKRLRYLSSHMLRVHSPTECARCELAFATSDQLKQHLLEQHAAESACPICAGADGRWRLPAHLAEHFPYYRCADCLATFHDAKQYRHHRLCCRLRDRLRCCHCADSFPSIQALRQHAMDAHQDQEPFKCGLCDCQYKFLAPLVRHEHRAHARPRLTKCGSGGGGPSFWML